MSKRRIDGRPCDEPNPFIEYMKQRAGDMILNCSAQVLYGRRTRGLLPILLRLLMSLV